MKSVRILPVLAAGLAVALALPAAANDFAIMDTNNDGTVSSSEYEVFASNTFNRADRNHDDKLTLDEVRAHVGITRGRNAGPSQFSAQQRYQRRDVNGDGEISRSEFMQGAAARFQELDADRNNAMTEQELAMGF